ncbi:RNA polymerase sigma factor [Jiangella alkaliphila]|uniref:RNA polymerase sigma-70 factor, ECF subfamily n=1 Tax=Jiangella alkaliphila TaxID=419479 RepID=A0A1H2JGW2_9ACTN|nr:sigma-70 family RNA polymerase sigma factor [Jiangella alkaliphila]SDU55670.1 RNA polymerase sigma-70 factor, ECF subfamily [Jiangella alkaliphila]
MREQGGHVLALLATRFGDLDLADDCVQDALVQAVETWTAQGIPANPPGWLYTVAHNRAVDRLRRAAAADRRLRAAAPQLTPSPESPDDAEREELVVDEREVGDEQLRLMLLCCHPALDRDTQVALTLRLVGGLTTAEIASAYLVPEPTLAQRIVRAKRKIRAAGIPLRVPARLDERVGVLLAVLSLIFNEGYLSRGGHADAVRADLADTAVRLTERTLGLLPGHPEVEGLLALQLYHRARLAGRLDGAGDLVLLERQDRTAWDGALIGRANALLARALGRDVPGPFQVQAFIASLHANAPTAADTDWPAVARAYTRLEELAPSPVVTLNRAVAIAMADGPRAGLAVLDGVAGLDRYHLWHAARAELLARAGEPERARAGFERALRLTTNPAEQRHLRGRLRELSPRT